MDTLYTGLVIIRRKKFAGSVTGTPTVSIYKNGILASTANGTGSGDTWVFTATVPAGTVGDSIQIEADGIVSGESQTIVLAEGQLVALQDVSGIAAAANSADTTIGETKTLVEINQALLEADQRLVSDGTGGYVLKTYVRGTNTELIPPKKARTPGGANLSDPSTQELGGYITLP